MQITSTSVLPLKEVVPKFELYRCPFCNSHKIKFFRCNVLDEQGLKSIAWTAACSNTDCMASTRALYDDKYFPEQDLAILWNRRVRKGGLFAFAGAYKNLLPCPFCGSAADFKVAVEHGPEVAWRVSCDNDRCMASTNAVFAVDCPEGHLRVLWNRRAGYERHHWRRLLRIDDQ